jgi:hypothetical protein
VPTKATTLMTVPITPVVTLPLSRHITLSMRATERTETDDHQSRGADMARQEGGAADKRSGYRQNAEDRVDRFSSLRGPVDVLQVEPQRELVECEADAHPEEGGGDVETCTVRRRGHQDDSCANDDQYPENLMVNVNSSEPDVAQPGPGTRPQSGAKKS